MTKSEVHLLALPTAALLQVLKEEKGIKLFSESPADEHLVPLYQSFLEITEKELLGQQENSEWFNTRFKNYLEEIRKDFIDYFSDSTLYTEINVSEDKSPSDTYVFVITFYL